MADEPTAADTTISGPWAADIQSLTSDPALQAAVDNFMRSKIQPRMTQLEQRVSQAQAAEELLNAFQTDPENTYRAVTAQLYGDEAAELLLNTLQSREAPAAPATPEVTPTAPAAPAFDPATSLTPQEVEQWRFQQQLEAYDKAVDEVLADPANADIDRDLYHTYVAAAEGNFQEGLVRYRDGVTRVLSRYGVDPTQATTAEAAQAAQIAEGEQRQAPPPVLGDDAGGAGAAPPTQPQYRGTEGLSRAIDDFMAGQHRNAEAPPVA